MPPSRRRAAAALEKPPAQRTTAEQEEIVAREEVVDRYESLASAQIRLRLALEQTDRAIDHINATGLAPAHITEPLRTVRALTEQSIARIAELLSRVPL